MISLVPENGPGIGVAGTDLNYTFHIKENEIESDLETFAKIQTFVSPNSWAELLEKILSGGSQTDMLTFMSMMETPIYVHKDIQVVSFYTEAVWENSEFVIRGNAPAGRRVFLSKADPLDFTDKYILSTFSNNNGNFIFPRISIPENTEVVVWYSLYPADSLGELSSSFKYWIDYQTNDIIADCIVNINQHNFTEEYKKYCKINVTSSWNPAEYYENNLFACCLNKSVLSNVPTQLIEPKSQDDCINNLLYVYNLKLKGMKLTLPERIILTQTFKTIKADYFTNRSSLLSNKKESFSLILAWSYFYDNVPEQPTLTISANNTVGYIDTIVVMENTDFSYQENQCDITVNCSWSIGSYPDTDIRLISVDIDESELDSVSSFTDVKTISDKQERDEACIKNLYLAYKKQNGAIALTETEKKILQNTAQVAPFDYVIGQASQKVYQQKSFKLTLGWASFYNERPDGPNIRLSLVQSDKLKMTGFYIAHRTILGNSNIDYHISWTPSLYRNNKIYKYGPTYFPAYNADELIGPEREEFAYQETLIGNIFYALNKQQSGQSFSDEEMQIMEKTFNAVSNVIIGDSFPQESGIASSQVLLWSIFYNNDMPQGPFIDITESTPCLTGDTLITMADGSYQRLDSIQVGDMVLGADGPTRVERVRISSPNEYYYINYFEDDIIIKESSPHRFYNVEQGFSQKLKKWLLGEHALTQQQKEVALIKRERVKGCELKYGLYTEAGTYYANTLLSGPMAVNRSLIETSSIEKVVNMVSSIDANRALGFAKDGVY